MNNPVSATKITYNSARLSWEPDSIPDWHDPLLYTYMISWKRDLLDHQFPVEVPYVSNPTHPSGYINSSGYEMENLVPNSQYNVSVRLAKRESPGDPAYISPVIQTVEFNTVQLSELDDYRVHIISPSEQSVITQEESYWGSYNQDSGFTADLLDPSGTSVSSTIYWIYNPSTDNPFNGTLLGFSNNTDPGKDYLGKYVAMEEPGTVWAIGVTSEGYAINSVSVYPITSIPRLIDWKTEFIPLQYTKRNCPYMGVKHSRDMKASLSEVAADLNTLYTASQTIESSTLTFAQNNGMSSGALQDRLAAAKDILDRYEELENG
jgi:hypothetical protein